MLAYTSPKSFMQTPEGRLTAILLAVTVGATACGGGGQNSSNKNTSTFSAKSSFPATASTTGNANPNTGNASTVSCQPGIATPQGYCEVQQFGAPGFKDYQSVIGRTDTNLPAGAITMVACRAPEETVASAKGGWYLVTKVLYLPDSAQSPDPAQYENHFYAANTFENGNTVGVPINRTYDDRIRNCTPQDIASIPK